MVDILMPVSILLIFYPPCLQWYASGVMSIVFLLQKGLFLVCAAYALKYRMYRNKYMVALLSYIVWLILVTYLNGMQIGEIGSYLNVFSCCVVYVYCLERNPQRIIGYTSIVFTLLLLFNTILWKDGGMYVNNSGQMSFVLGTKTSLTEYQIAACGFIGTYFTLLPKHKKKKAVILGLCVVYSVIVWNIHEPISTSEMCLAVFFVILILGALGGKIGEAVLKWGFLGMNILNVGIVFFNTARVLGAENIGIYSYTYAIVSSVVMFGALGTATYGQKEIASAGENIVERSEKFLEIWVLKAVTMVIAFLIFVPYAYQTTAWIYYALQIPYIVAGVFDISFFFQGIEKFRYIAVRNTIVRIAGIVLLFSLVKSSNDLWIYLLIISVSQLLGNLSMWPYLRGNICRVKLTTRNVMKHLSNVMIYFIPSITYQIYAVLDKAMLGWLVGSNYENGYYEQANKIVNLVVNVISSYTIVMRSRMSALFAQKRNEEIQEKMAVSYNVIAFLVFPMTFGIAAIAAGMVPWFFGDGYDAVIGLLYIFCPIFIFMGYSRMIGTHILTPSGRQQQSNYAQIIAAVVNITLNSLLIPRFFAKGAAVASVTAELVLVLVYYYMVRKEILLKQVIEMGWKKAIAAGIMFVFVFTIGKNFSISIFYTFVEILIGAIVYVIVLVVLRDAFVCKYIDKTFHKILGQRRK